MKCITGFFFKGGLICLIMCSVLHSAEVQIHYDKDKNPERLFGTGHYLITLENAAPTAWGDMFFFVDAKGTKDSEFKTDYLYYEINTGISFKKMFNMKPLGFVDDIQFHIELNDSGASFINRRILYGLDFKIKNRFTQLLKFSVLYSNEDNRDSGHYQLTLVWFKQFKIKNQTFLFKGFADYWETDNGLGRDYEILSVQPQLVWKASKNVKVGTELEITSNLYELGKSYINQSFFVAFVF